MSDTVFELQERVLTLPEADRAALVEVVLASLQPKSSAQHAWAQLAVRRRNDVRAGTGAMVAGDAAIAGIRAKLV